MVVTQDFTAGSQGAPLDGFVESCPLCGRSGVREDQDGVEVIVHAEATEMLSDGMTVEPCDCCYL